jgi:hypothetical protein
MAMAFSLPSLGDESELALQRGVERQVRALLHRVRNPQALAATPLMDVVCKAMGTSNPVTALERIVLTVFDGDDERAISLRSAILEADFKRLATNAELARQKGVSRRHFQRRRAKAVAVIAQFTRTMLARSGAQTDGASMGTWRFERERAEYERARERGAAPQMRAVARNLLRVADNRAARAFAIECLADANVRLGRTEEVAGQLASLSSPARERIRAKLAILCGSHDEAADRARAALDATSEQRYERYECLALLSQLRLARCAPWRPPREIARLACATWERTSMEVEKARHLAREQKWERAETLARAAHHKAACFGYGDLAARCAAVLYTLTKCRGEIAAARRWRAQAIYRLLPTEDRVLATGLFREPDDEFWNEDEGLNQVLYQRLCLIVPQMLGEGEKRQIPVRHLIAAIIDPRSGDGSRADFAEVVARAARSGSAFGNYAERCIAPVSEMLALAFVALTGSSWATAFERIRNAVAFSARELRPAASRAIAIAVPARRFESQFGSFNHLSFDDEPSVGVRAASQSRADLRLRLLSI